MKKEIRLNQALMSHVLYFDPVSRNEVIPNTKKGDKPATPGQEHRIGASFKHYPAYRTLEDGSFEVYFYAPEAKTVRMVGIIGAMLGGYDLVKGEDGTFVLHIDNPPVGFHFVHFYVDGVRTIHPTMPVGYGAHKILNYLEVADPDNDFYLLKKVPHGRLHIDHIWSDTTERYRNAWVYTPPAYDENPDKRYPVLYIQHGGGENEMGWFYMGKLNYIADNLIAEDACKEMIIVCCAGDHVRHEDDTTCVNLNYAEAVVKEIVPYIDANYRTIADREYRCMAGLSMGGGQAREIAHTYPEVFANMGQFSSGAGFVVEGESLYGHYDYSELFKTPEHYNSLMKLTFISCGLDDPRHAYTSVQCKELMDKGYNVEYHVYPGDHEWNPWRQSARDLMKELFR